MVCLPKSYKLMLSEVVTGSSLLSRIANYDCEFYSLQHLRIPMLAQHKLWDAGATNTQPIHTKQGKTNPFKVLSDLSYFTNQKLLNLQFQTIYFHTTLNFYGFPCFSFFPEIFSDGKQTHTNSAGLCSENM